MNIAVVGLGLIGGSFCKAIKKYTDHHLFGIDTDSKTIEMALECGAIEREIEPAELNQMDFTIISLHPLQTIAFLQSHAHKFKSGSLVMDTCGIKTAVVEAVTDPLRAHDVIFVGCHPMAGREFSGFAYAVDNLYENASFIITPQPDTPVHITEFIKYFAQKLQFKKVVVTTAEEHDRVIAFTSQLAHVVSNAYIKSPSLQQEAGFSAGSFLDLTRVAKLNASMWCDLFMLNQGPLIAEIDTIIEHLLQYKAAMLAQNREELRQLLHDGSMLKEESLKRRA